MLVIGKSEKNPRTGIRFHIATMAAAYDSAWLPNRKMLKLLEALLEQQHDHD
tara:strand:+ start:328 stop:483 length:156 start_codon:yes stop_codon:yes gene_type:complete